MGIKISLWDFLLFGFLKQKFGVSSAFHLQVWMFLIPWIKPVKTSRKLLKRIKKECRYLHDENGCCYLYDKAFLRRRANVASFWEVSSIRSCKRDKIFEFFYVIKVFSSLPSLLIIFHWLIVDYRCPHSCFFWRGFFAVECPSWHQPMFLLPGSPDCRYWGVCVVLVNESFQLFFSRLGFRC